jgi:outer membrane protein
VPARSLTRKTLQLGEMMGTLTFFALLRLAAAAPLTLDDALTLAAKQNADLQIARADRDTAAADLRGSYQGVLPRLDLNGTFGHQWQGAQHQVNVVPNATPPPDFVRVPVVFPANDTGEFQLGLTLNWTAFDGLQSWNLIGASRDRAQAAGRLYDESALQVAFNVTQLFYELVKQQRALEVANETAALSAEFVKRSDALYTAGRGTKGDTYTSRVNHGNDLIAVKNQEAVVARARAGLAVALGLTADPTLEVVAPAPVAGGGQPEAQELPPLSELQATARAHRPLLAAQKLSRSAADRDVSRARGAYWPVLALQASYAKVGPDFSGSSGILSTPSEQYVATIQGTVALNLFAGGSTRAGVQRAEAQARRAEALLEQSEESISDEVVSGRAQVEALAGSVATAREDLASAEKGLRFMRERLDAGVGSQLEVRDATLKYSQAELTLFDTVVDLVVARANLNRALGGAL